MTDRNPNLIGDNPYHSETPVRQLTASDLGISVSTTNDQLEANIWEQLQKSIKDLSEDGARVAIATDDETITTSIDTPTSSSRPVHAIELGVLKAYSETQSQITHVLVQKANNEFSPCGHCLQTILDYSNEALVRIVDRSGDCSDEFILDQPLVMDVGNDDDDDAKKNKEDTTSSLDVTDDESERMPVPEKPPFIDVDLDGDEVVEFVRMNAPVYHLKYQTHHQTFCGTDLRDRDTTSSTEEPTTLLDPCKRCHGETSQETVEEQRINLRAQLAERVESVREIEEKPVKFNESELSAILSDLPVDAPSGGESAIALRDQLSQAVVDIHQNQETPLTFSRAEMESILAALDGDGTISDEPNLFVYTSEGRVARISLSNLSLQRRAGKGEHSFSLDDGEIPTKTLAISPREQMYIFTDLGKVHQVNAHMIPTLDHGGKPAPLSDLIHLNEEEALEATLTSYNLADHDYVILGSKHGYIKRTPTEEFENIHRGGIKAVELEGDDLLQGACLMDGDKDLLMSTRSGRTIRFEGAEIRPMGRAARGVLGIELDDGDEVVAVNVVDEDVAAEVFTVTAEGFGKRTDIEGYRKQSRNGSGLVDISTGERNGPVIAVEMASSGSKFVAISEAGRSIHAEVDGVSVVGRNTKGVEIMNLNENDWLSGLAIFHQR